MLTRSGSTEPRFNARLPNSKARTPFGGKPWSGIHFASPKHRYPRGVGERATRARLLGGWPGALVLSLICCPALSTSSHALSEGSFHLLSRENVYKAQRSPLLAFSLQSLSFRIPDPKLSRVGRGRQRGMKRAEMCSVPEKVLWSLSPPNPTLGPGVGATKDYRNSTSFGNPRAEDSCVLSWGASREALGLPCTQHGIGARQWLQGLSGQPGIPVHHSGSIRDHSLSSREARGPDRKEGCAQDPRMEPQRPFSLVTKEQLEQPPAEARLC